MHKALAILATGTPINWLPNNSMQGAVVGVLGSGGALPTGWAVNTANGLATEVVAIGVEGGIDYIDVKISGTPSSTAYQIRTVGPPYIPAAPGQSWTVSGFYALTAGDTTNITSVNHAIILRNAAATILQNLILPFTPAAGALGGSRKSDTSTLSNASTAFVQHLSPWIVTTAGQAVNITLRMGWPQLVRGRSAVAPIRTTGRAASGPRFGYI
jgi:hypothetical protein